MKVSRKLITRMVKLLFYVSLIALLVTPVLPWATSTFPGEEDNPEWYVKMHFANSENKTLLQINDNINYASYGFFFGLVFSMVANVGILLRRLRNKLYSNYLMLSSIPLTVSGAVALIFSVRVMFMIKGLGGSFEFGYNYVPLFMAVPLMVVSLVLSTVIVPKSIEEIPEQRRRKKQEKYYWEFHEDSEEEGERLLGNVRKFKDSDEGLQHGSDEEIEPEEQIDEEREMEETVEEKRTCPSCGEPLDERALLCPNCGENLATKCPECGKLYPEDEDRCPHCGMYYIR